MPDDYPEQRPPFRPTLPTPARMLALTHAIGDAAEAIENEDMAALQQAMDVAKTGTEQRLMLSAAATLAVLVLQEEAAERGVALTPNRFALPDDGPHYNLAAAMLNAASTGDADAARVLVFTSELTEVVPATVVLAHVMADADKAVFTDRPDDGG